MLPLNPFLPDPPVHLVGKDLFFFQLPRYSSRAELILSLYSRKSCSLRLRCKSRIVRFCVLVVVPLLQSGLDFGCSLLLLQGRLFFLSQSALFCFIYCTIVSLNIRLLKFMFSVGTLGRLLSCLRRPFVCALTKSHKFHLSCLSLC